MINSMTGYGEAESQIAGIDYLVEIKAVNNRYLRSMIKLPDAVTFLEEHVEKMLRQQLGRGTVNYTLKIKGAAPEKLFDLDEDALQHVAGRLERIRANAGIEQPVDIAALLSLPGMVRPVVPSEDVVEQIKAGLIELSQKALDKLKAMRAEEGKFMAEDLMGHCTVIREDLAQIEERRGVVMVDHAERLRKRVDSLLAEAKLKLDEETLAREVAVLAERSDIAEELARLKSHLHQFQQACSTDGEQVGRRLDFLSQEMLREANTIGSKASDIEISQWVVNIKCRVDRIKEQVQNVE